MPACFKLPSLAKRPRPPSQFLEFKWSEVKLKAELGCGTFRSVYLVKYGREDRGNGIVKKMKGESAEAKRRFDKEAEILNTVKGHRNISEFLSPCFTNPVQSVFSKSSPVCIFQIHVLQIHVLQIHVLQIQSMFYKSNPCFTNQIQTTFYNMPANTVELKGLSHAILSDF